MGGFFLNQSITEKQTGSLRAISRNLAAQQKAITCRPTNTCQLKPSVQSIKITQDGMILVQLWCVREDFVSFEKFHSRISLN